MEEKYLHVKETTALQASDDTVIIACITINELTGDTEETTLYIPSDVFLRDFGSKFLRDQAKERYIKYIKNL